MDASKEKRHERVLRDAVLAGDAEAWRLLYERAFAPLYAAVHRETGKRLDRTEEVVQESWLIVVRRLREFDPERGSFAAWLRGIAANVARNHRRRWRQEDHEPVAMDALASPSAADDDRAPTGEHIAATLASLPERYRAVLQAKYSEHLTVADIGRRWGASTRAIESLLVRARMAFRQIYERLEGKA